MLLDGVLLDGVLLLIGGDGMSAMAGASTMHVSTPPATAVDEKRRVTRAMASAAMSQPVMKTPGGAEARTRTRPASDVRDSEEATTSENAMNNDGGGKKGGGNGHKKGRNSNSKVNENSRAPSESDDVSLFVYERLAFVVSVS